MKLSELIKPWVTTKSSIDCVITGLQNDSRMVQPGDVFIAYPGAATDGRLFIDKAVSLGAVAIIYEPKEWPPSLVLPTQIPCVAIENLVVYLAAIAQRFYGHPSQSLLLTGITGTNGKTTIAYQLAQAHELLGQKAAYIGTIGQGPVNQLSLLDNTTPDGLCLQKLLAGYKKEGIQTVCMEVSSHALSQHRVDGLVFNQAIFTNLTLDHLDYHRTMESYAAAKAMLFAHEHLRYAIINQDDAYHGLMIEALQPHVQKVTYGFKPGCDVQVLQWQMSMQGTHIDIQSPWGFHHVYIKSLGQFNIYNSLAVFISLMLSEYPVEQVLKVMAELKAAPGRLELVHEAPYVLVDYAHTPDALANVLMTLKQLKQGQLWVIFGCGGDRDKTKRPIMGKVAADHADQLVITSDNPRSEDPERIIADILPGVPNSAHTTQLVNRKDAIAFALHQASKEDIILIAGKGHEAYQQIGKVKHAFSDQEIARALLS